jgi:hypothetical protein
MYIGGLDSTCVEIRGVEMLTLIGGLCCDGFINSTGIAAGP